MEDTSVKNVTICQPEQRNIYNKIFGGFLMRKAFELAWINACMFSKSRPLISVVDDITFKKPVVIGSILYFNSHIVYTKGNEMVTKVLAEKVEPETGEHEVTNEFFFTFVAPDRAQLSQVIPKSYAEAMMFIEGKRHV